MSDDAVVVSLSPAAQDLADRIHDDMQAIFGLIGEMVVAQQQLADIIRTDVIVAVNAIEAERNGPTVFDEAEHEIAGEKPQPKRRRSSARVELPPEMREPITRLEATGGELKSSPFTRASRGTQVTWLIQVLSDYEWHAPSDLADEYATDPRHRRYLRGALQTRLKEMHEDQEAPLERRRSTVRGSMFEYRLKLP